MPNKKILIAPLNWGLGHATRCMPLIEAFRAQGCEVIIASDGAALDLLRAEYPDVRCLRLPAYNIRYPFQSMILSIALQMPQLLRGGIGEYLWLRRFIKNEKIDLVVSDNRFGLFNRHVRCLFMTHQINILMPNRFLQFWANRANHFFIKKFDACLVPDNENTPRLAGQLAHGNFTKTLKIKYIGALTRFNHYKTDKKYDAIAVLSGPEPQRTYFEKIIIEAYQKQLFNEPEPAKVFCLVRGVMSQQPKKIKGIDIFNYLTAKDLNQKILESQLLITRSGYSTVMDLTALGVPAVLVPTPGQTEQEYLATHLKEQGIFFSQKQTAFNLDEIFTKIPFYSGFNVTEMNNNAPLSKIISELLEF